NDPVIKYIKNTREPTLKEKIVSQAEISAYLVICLRTEDDVALTIDSGIANIIIKSPPECSEKPKEDPVVRFANWVLAVLGIWRNNRYRDPETTKRQKEVIEKLMTKEVQKRWLGDRLDKMWYVDGIFTDPACQGRGYGSALLEAATATGKRT
ncbi:hypothetical protein C0995_001332, partial [Termitomyces sp. Mi166